MAVSAYSEKGLLKKNPLLGTSLAVDPTRKKQRVKFGELHERATKFQGTKEEFQEGIAAEHEKAQAPGLAAYAQAQQSLGEEQTALSGFQTKQREFQNIIARAEEVKGMYGAADWKKMSAFEAANPELAQEAHETWGSLGETQGADDAVKRKGYKKGKRPTGVASQFEELKARAEQEMLLLNEQHPELMQYMEQEEGRDFAEPGQGGDYQNEAWKNVGSAFQDYGKDLMQDFIDVNNVLNIVKDPKNFLMSGVLPGKFAKNLGSLFGSGKKAKKKLKKLKKHRRAAGRGSALLDEYALRAGEAKLGTLRNVGDIATSSQRVSELERTIGQQRKTLEDQANFYGSFFA